VLTPLANWLRRLTLPRITTVLIAVTPAFILIGGLGFIAGRQLVQLASNRLADQTTFGQKARSSQQSAPGNRQVERWRPLLRISVRRSLARRSGKTSRPQHRHESWRRQLRHPAGIRMERPGVTGIASGRRR
jgi:predicted PurR-regulated permease PerM